MADPDFSQTPLDELRIADLRATPRARISPHFCLYELTRSESASRLNIDNQFPDDDTLRNAVHLARNVLEPLREAFGSFTPNSVFRSQALDAALKKKPHNWRSTSQHTLGCACDVEIVGKPTLELADWVTKNIPVFDQLICECYNPASGPNSGWVHISLLRPGQGNNRKQLLSYVTDPKSGKLVYVAGLQADSAVG